MRPPRARCAALETVRAEPRSLRAGRWGFLRAAGAFGLCWGGMGMSASAEATAGRANLLTAPIQLAGVPLHSDRQPGELRVDDHSSGPPSIWLHVSEPTVAWIIVDIGALDWCRLTYQFGHELGLLAAAWFRSDRDSEQDVGAWEGPAIIGILGLLEAGPSVVAVLGAVNRWPARSAVPIEEYLTLWEASCKEIGSAGVLPVGIGALFGLG